MNRKGENLACGHETAYHEAAHFILGAWDIEQIDIRQSFDWKKIFSTDFAGSVRGRAISCLICDIKGFTMKSILELIGWIAGERYERGTPLNSEDIFNEYDDHVLCDEADDPKSDYSKLKNMIDFFFITPYGKYKVLECALETACNIVNNKKTWKTFSEIAEEIFKKRYIKDNAIKPLREKALKIEPLIKKECDAFYKKIFRFKNPNGTIKDLNKIKIKEGESIPIRVSWSMIEYLNENCTK